MSVTYVRTCVRACVSTYLPTYLPIYLSVCLSIYRSIYLSRTPKLMQISWDLCKTCHFMQNRAFACDFHKHYVTVGVRISKKCAKCLRGKKEIMFNALFSCLFHTFFVPFSLLFVAKKQNPENCDGFLQRGIPSLVLDLRLSDKICDFSQSPCFSCDLVF